MNRERKEIWPRRVFPIRSSSTLFDKNIVKTVNFCRKEFLNEMWNTCIFGMVLTKLPFKISVSSMNLPRIHRKHGRENINEILKLVRTLINRRHHYIFIDFIFISMHLLLTVDECHTWFVCVSLSCEEQKASEKCQNQNICPQWAFRITSMRLWPLGHSCDDAIPLESAINREFQRSICLNLCPNGKK